MKICPPSTVVVRADQSLRDPRRCGEKATGRRDGLVTKSAKSASSCRSWASIQCENESTWSGDKGTCAVGIEAGVDDGYMRRGRPSRQRLGPSFVRGLPPKWRMVAPFRPLKQSPCQNTCRGCQSRRWAMIRGAASVRAWIGWRARRKIEKLDQIRQEVGWAHEFNAVEPSMARLCCRLGFPHHSIELRREYDK